MTGNGQFSVAIDQFIGKVAAKNEQNCRKVYIELATDIIMGTPKDKGITTNNWIPSIGSPASGTREIADTSGALVISEVKSVAVGWKPEKGDAFLTNNSIVAVVHEYGLYPNPPKKGKGKTINGFSTQAVGGMVGLSIAKKKGSV